MKNYFKKNINQIIPTTNILVLKNNLCENSDVLEIVQFLGNVLDTIFFIVPIILILILSIDFLKNIIANNTENMKKNLQIAIKRIIMTGGLFLVPTIVTLLLNIIDGNNLNIKYADCITNANPDTIAAYRSKEETALTPDTNEEIPTANLEKNEPIKTESSNTTQANNNNTNKTPNNNTSNKKENNYITKLGKGKGPAKKISIKYNVTDSKGRCGKGKYDTCAAVATVKYQTETVKYYMGYQNNSWLISGSCRSHAFMSVVNAIKGTTYSTLDLQNYLKKSVNNSGILYAKGIDKSIKKYKLNATVYHSETSKTKAAKLMKKALDNGQPVMIFVANSLCSDIAGTHHALLVLGYDEKGNAVFIDSVPYAKKAKKRNIEELAQCIPGTSISDSYYRMIIFSFD